MERPLNDLDQQIQDDFPIDEPWIEEEICSDCGEPSDECDCHDDIFSDD